MNQIVNLPLIEAIAAEIRETLGDDDADTLLDTLDGETDVLDILDQLIRDRGDASAYEEACRAEAEAYLARAKRFADRRASINTLMGKVLDATGEKKIVRPLATVSRTRGHVSVLITDEASVPTQLCKTVRTPDKAAIKAQLEAGETVLGAELQTGAPGVAVRR